MIIILEGADRTGKSTLAAELKRLTGGEVIHAGKPTQPPLWEYLAPLADVGPHSDRHVILDRWHWGEWIWPKIFGRESEMTWDLLKTIDKELMSRGAFTIYCHREDYRRWAKELVQYNEPIGVAELFTALDMYEHVERAMPTACFWYDWTESDLQDEAAKFVEHARWLAEDLRDQFPQEYPDPS